VVHVGLILFFGMVTLAGMAMPWDAVCKAQGGIARFGFVGLLPIVAIGVFMLLRKRSGASGWFLAALMIAACFPLWAVVASPEHLMRVMASRLSEADAAYLWTNVDLAIGKLTDRADVPDMGDTPRGFWMGSIEWLSPAYWLMMSGLTALFLAALASPRRGSPRGSVFGYAAATCGALMLSGWMFAGFLLTERWDSALKALARPDASPVATAKAVAFVDSYPPALLNPLFRSLLAGPVASLALDPGLRADLRLMAKTWQPSDAPLLLARLPEPEKDRKGLRMVALRRLWWGPTLRTWMQRARSLNDYQNPGILMERLGDQRAMRMWEFFSEFRQGQWDRALALGETLCADKAYTAYQSTMWDVLGTLYTRLGMPDKAIMPWQNSFGADPTNNDPAIRGLGAVGP